MTIAMMNDAAKSTLRRSDYAELRGLEVEAHPEGLVLRGAVHSFYYKQLAQEILRSLAVANGCRVINQLDVMDVVTV